MRASDIAAVVGVISPVSQGVGSVSSGWIPVKDFYRFQAIVLAGVLGAAATLDAKFQQATDAAGTGVKDFAPAKNAAQLVKATDDNKQAVLNLRADEVDKDNLFNHVRLTLTVAAAASLAGAVIIGVSPDYGAASDYDAASVKDIA